MGEQASQDARPGAGEGSPPERDAHDPAARERGVTSRRAPEVSSTGWTSSPASYAIIAVNLAVFAAQLLWAGDLRVLVSMPHAVMLAFGANLASATWLDHHVETLLTSCFLHFSALHIGFNMMALRQVGPLVERSVGTARFLPMYLVSGIAGSACSALAWVVHHAPNDVRLSAGASGAICGAIGAAMVLGVRAQGWRGPIAQSMARWLAVTFVLGFVGQFDNAAHAGGAVAGAVCASLWRRGYRASTRKTAAVVALASALGFGALVTVVLRDERDPYATLDAEARYERAVAAYSARRCEDAHRAITAASRLAPDAPQVQELARRIEQRCGP